MGIKLTFKFETGLVRQGLENLFAEPVQIGRQKIRTVMNRIVRRMQEYPDEPAGQSVQSQHPILGTVSTRAPGRYQRTGRLFSHWKIAEEKAGGYSIANTAQRNGKAYARYVVGDARGNGQAWMHKGRWQLLRDVSDEEIAKLPAEVTAAIVLVARKQGFKAA